MASSVTQLARALHFPASLSLVVGSMIGTGVFLKTATMAQLVGSPLRVIAAWAVAGVLSTIGALAYAEVASRYPRAGGEYIYLREGYGPFVAFLYGWTRFWIGSPGSVAAYAVGSATFLSGVLPIDAIGGKPVALFLIVLFTSLNCWNVSVGGGVQTAITAAKVILIVAITGGIFFLSPGEGSFATPGAHEFSGLSAFGMAMISALWAYDGWNNLPMASGEVVDAQRNVPRALIVGACLVFGVYAIVNAAYFYALPISEISSANSARHPNALPVATRAAESFLGISGLPILSGLLVVSALGAMNGSILTGARVPYAMALDGLFFSRLGMVNATSRVPMVSVMVQGFLAACLAATGTFDQLTEYVVFTSWIFYGLVAYSVFRLRRRPGAPAARYRVAGYPWLPGLFCLASVLLLVNTLIASPRDSLLGLLFVVMGVPAHWFFARRQRRRAPLP